MYFKYKANHIKTQADFNLKYATSQIFFRIDMFLIKFCFKIFARFNLCFY